MHVKFGAKEGHNIPTHFAWANVCPDESEAMSNKFSVMYTHCVPK
jgi:hypothetical protein